MESLERHAFWRGYKDYQAYLKQRSLRLHKALDSRYPTPWWPPEGHEEAYSLGWETAKAKGGEGISAPPSDLRSQEP